MVGTYVQKGESIDYTNGGSTTVAFGTVVGLGTRCGVAAADIPAGAVGELELVGVFSFPKDTSDIALGAAVFYDASADKVTTTGTGNTPLGYAIAAAGTAATTVSVSIGTPRAAQAAVQAANATTNATDLTTAQALANSLKTDLNALIAKLKASGLMANS